MSRRRPLLIAALLATVAVAGTGLVLSTGDDDEPTLAGEEPARAAPLVQACNGDEAFCDLTLDRVVFPGTHNSMSSVAYGPAVRRTEPADPACRSTPASEPSSSTPTTAASTRPAPRRRGGRSSTAAIQGDIFLCHVRCELGALPVRRRPRRRQGLPRRQPVRGRDADRPGRHQPRRHRRRHCRRRPDRTCRHAAGEGEHERRRRSPPPDTSGVDRVREEPRRLRREGRPRRAPWYQQAFDWFQETPFTFTDANRMGCEASRGRAYAALFLVNHWVVTSPPDPAAAAVVNARPQLEDRFRRRLAERGRLPNVVAVDFADQGDVVATLRDLNRTLTR